MKTLVSLDNHSTNLELVNKVTRKQSRSSRNIIADLYNNLLKEYAKGPYAYGALSILGQSCIASIAAMYILMNLNDFSNPSQIIQLCLVTIPCFGYNITVISQQKIKIQVNVLIISVLTSVTLLCINAF